jgi:hypothetical protein
MEKDHEKDSLMYADDKKEEKKTHCMMVCGMLNCFVDNLRIN